MCDKSHQDMAYTEVKTTVCDKHILSNTCSKRLSFKYQLPDTGCV